MGGYDLYGTYYPSSEDALDAEEAQMTAIDAGLTYRKQKEFEDELFILQYEQSVLRQEIANLQEQFKDKKREGGL